MSLRNLSLAVLALGAIGFSVADEEQTEAPKGQKIKFSVTEKPLKPNVQITIGDMVIIAPKLYVKGGIGKFSSDISVKDGRLVMKSDDGLGVTTAKELEFTLPVP